jgi:ribosomal protein L36
MDNSKNKSCAVSSKHRDIKVKPSSFFQAWDRLCSNIKRKLNIYIIGGVPPPPHKKKNPVNNQTQIKKRTEAQNI